MADSLKPPDEGTRESFQVRDSSIDKLSDSTNSIFSRIKTCLARLNPFTSDSYSPLKTEESASSSSTASVSTKIDLQTYSSKLQDLENKADEHFSILKNNTTPNATTQKAMEDLGKIKKELTKIEDITKEHCLPRRIASLVYNIFWKQLPSDLIAMDLIARIDKVLPKDFETTLAKFKDSIASAQKLPKNQTRDSLIWGNPLDQTMPSIAQMGSKIIIYILRAQLDINTTRTQLVAILSQMHNILDLLTDDLKQKANKHFNDVVNMANTNLVKNHREIKPITLEELNSTLTTPPEA
jgi:hypothetical protein